MDGLNLLHLMLFSLLGASLASWMIYEFDNYGQRYTSVLKRLSERSKCDYCQEQVSYSNLVPVLSYIFLGGKTSCCSTKLSKKYIIFESFGALIFAVGYLTNSLEISILGFLIIFIIFNDEKYKEIPIWINLALFSWVIIFGDELIENNFLPALYLAFALMLLYLFFLKVRRVEGLGLADIILLFSISLYLGFPDFLYLITISSASLLIKIILTKKLREPHAFGSWIAGTFGVFILFQEFYVSVN
jgi:prepilin signal peptidase PulO-like enzyme (type II secretory pathway)